MPSAYLLMRCEEGAEKMIIRNLVKKDIIKEVQPTIGHYDLIAKITSQSAEDFDDVIRKIHLEEKIRATNVLLMSD